MEQAAVRKSITVNRKMERIVLGDRCWYGNRHGAL
jgi:hypothetical protein